ncbi:MAG: hypothetical protein AAF378_08660 [Cyanobacteria bacterium P01_A01_bin.84]
MVFQPNQLPEVKEGKDILTTLDLLESWKLSVEDIFNSLRFG